VDKKRFREIGILDSSIVGGENLRERNALGLDEETYPAPSDSALVCACLDGNQMAWNALIARYEGLIYSLALRSGLPITDAEDVFQDVCLILFEHLCELRDVSRLPGWLAMTTRREVWRRFRRVEAARLAESNLTRSQTESVALAMGHNAELPEEILLSIERRSELQQAMRLLPERCRRLLTLLYCIEPPCSYAEVAERLRIPLGSIGPERARSLKRLQKILETNGFLAI